MCHFFFVLHLDCKFKFEKGVASFSETTPSPIFLVALLYGSYPMSVMFSYCLIGNYPLRQPFFAGHSMSMTSGKLFSTSEATLANVGTSRTGS